MRFGCYETENPENPANEKDLGGFRDVALDEEEADTEAEDDGQLKNDEKNGKKSMLQKSIVGLPFRLLLIYLLLKPNGVF